VAGGEDAAADPDTTMTSTSCHGHEQTPFRAVNALNTPTIVRLLA
jgi:hypothetical protein